MVDRLLLVLCFSPWWFMTIFAFGWTIVYVWRGSIGTPFGTVRRDAKPIVFWALSVFLLAITFEAVAGTTFGVYLALTNDPSDWEAISTRG